MTLFRWSQVTFRGTVGIAFSLPLEIAAIVGGIYRLIDMGSTTVNCMGDMVGTSVVANLEGKKGKD